MLLRHELDIAERGIIVVTMFLNLEIIIITVFSDCLYKVPPGEPINSDIRINNPLSRICCTIEKTKLTLWPSE